MHFVVCRISPQCNTFAANGLIKQKVTVNIDWQVKGKQIDRLQGLTDEPFDERKQVDMGRS